MSIYQMNKPSCNNSFLIKKLKDVNIVKRNGTSPALWTHGWLDLGHGSTQEVAARLLMESTHLRKPYIL